MSTDKRQLEGKDEEGKKKGQENMTNTKECE